MMPVMTVWALRIALIWLSLGLTFGALLLVDKATGWLMLGPAWLHAHIAMLMYGWVLQAVFAIGYWILPKFGRERPRGKFALVALIAVNLGVVAATALPRTYGGKSSSILVIAALACFVVHAWPRVKPFSE